MSTSRTLPTTPERARLMARVRQTGTAPELAVRKLLHTLGVRFRTRATDLPGSPDIVNRRHRWAIFVHGCYWHAHEDCHLWKLPKQNRAFWQDKFARNRERDRRKLLALERAGYAILVIWQCELAEPEALREKVLAFFGSRGGKLRKVWASGSDRKNGVRGPEPAGRETYLASPTQLCVSRIVSLDAGNTFKTRRVVGEACRDASPRAAFEQAFLRRKTSPRPTHGWPELRCADMFCGCGGLSLGAREACLAAGLRFFSALAVDADPNCMEVYRRNFSCRLPLRQDIQRVISGKLGEKATEHETELLGKIGSIDILLAGPPCQGNSDLNNHTRRRDKRNRLYERVARFVELVRPTHVLIENVPAAIHGVERAVQRTSRRIQEAGYTVDQGVVDLARLGVPQRRKRHVVVASATRAIRVTDVLAGAEVASQRTVRWAIGDLEGEEPDGVFTSPARHSDVNLKRMQYLLDNDLYDLPNHMRPPCHRNGHTYKSMYGRLRWDAPAQTITSGFMSPGQGRFVHPARPRTLTPHEAARLQLFPDFFDFSSIESRRALARMIGNAVPMNLGYLFCLEFLS